MIVKQSLVLCHMQPFAIALWFFPATVQFLAGAPDLEGIA
jgi:hypothetical protein